MAWVRGYQIGYELRMAVESGLILRYVDIYPSVLGTDPKTGSYSIYNGGGPAGAGDYFPESAQIRGGAWMKHNGTLTPVHILVATGNDDVFPVDLIYDSEKDELTLKVDDVAQDSIAAAQAGFRHYNTWYHLGYNIESGSHASIYLNGRQILTASPGPTADMDGMYWLYAVSTGWNSWTILDDIYADYDVAGGQADAAPPSPRFIYSNTDGVGTNAEWTPLVGSNWQEVDDPVPDDDATYNEALSAPLLDTHNTGSISVPVHHSVEAAIPIAISKKLSPAASTLKLVVYDGASTKKSAVALGVPMDYDPVWDRFDTDADGDPWTESEFNSSEFGYESAGTI